MRLASILFVPALAVLASPTLAQTSDQDVRCMLASNFFARAEKNPAKNEVAVRTGYFYLGRLDGRIAPAQLKAQLAAQRKSLTPSNLGQVMNACALHMKASGDALQALGQQLNRSGDK